MLSGPVLRRWYVIDNLLGAERMPEVPVDPGALSRNPRWASPTRPTPLVWHGPFRRPAVQAFDRMLRTVTADGSVGAPPTLWGHGTDDGSVPLEGSRRGIEAIRGAT